MRTEHPTKDEINELKDLLFRLEDQAWTVRPNPQFKRELEKKSGGQLNTNQGATGSPPQKNN